jgi:hypothetical protein
LAINRQQRTHFIMDEKISLKALEDYSDDYASKVTASFFSAKEKITGPEILKICDIHQVNLFVIRELLHAWKLESQRLRSPFFDYSAPAVVEALTKFQNLLSNTISISRENFQPLLKKAVHQTLYLILDPYDFYADTLDSGTGGSVKVDDLKSDIKYVKINRTPMEKLLLTLEERKLTTLSGNEAFALLDRILEEVNFTPEDIEAYVIQFSAVLPLHPESFYEKKPSIAPTVVESKNQPVVRKPEALKPEPAKPEVTKTDVPKKTSVAQTTLYDQFPKGTSNTLADNFQKKKKIKETLTINQKFMFTKILFNGDFELFSTAIERLDELENLGQATSFLANNYGEWNKETEEYQEFIEMVERRFAN